MKRDESREPIERLKDGEDFATLVKENSEDGSAQWADYLFGKGKMRAEKAALALEPAVYC